MYLDAWARAIVEVRDLRPRGNARKRPSTGNTSEGLRQFLARNAKSARSLLVTRISLRPDRPHVLQGFNRGRIDAPVAGDCAIVVSCESNKEDGASRRLRVRGLGLLNADFIQMRFQRDGIEARQRELDEDAHLPFERH